MSRLFQALMPTSATLLELAAEHVLQDEDHTQLSTMNHQLASLRGSPQLLAIAQNDPSLAMSFKAVLDMAEEGDWEQSLDALDHVALRLRDLRNESRADAAGVVRRA